MQAQPAPALLWAGLGQQGAQLELRLSCPAWACRHGMAWQGGRSTRLGEYKEQRLGDEVDGEGDALHLSGRQADCQPWRKLSA
jgi:hypothetical protein